MHVESLKLTNVRSIDSATLSFKPGFNLVVGVNGVGKTTVLDALCFALSHVVNAVSGAKTPAREPSPSDIRFGADGLTVECTVNLDGDAHTYLLHEPSPDAGVSHQSEGKPREQTHTVKPRREFLGAGPGRVGSDPPAGRPLAVLFSTRRAAAARSEAKRRRAVGGIRAAFAEALHDREFGLSELADWMRAQRVLSAERPESERVLQAFEAAIQRFLPGYHSLRVVENTGRHGRGDGSDFRDGDGSAGGAGHGSGDGYGAGAGDGSGHGDGSGRVQRRPPLAKTTHTLLIDRGDAEVVSLDALSDADRASVLHAIARAEDHLALHWTGQHLGENPSPAALDADRRMARAARIEEELAQLVPTCRNLRDAEDGTPDALIERLPTTIPVTQLSDGERGTLAMVLDLTRRLAQANPHLPDPAAEAEAIVLIDEIDLHLHPRWQRDVIHSLTAVFPRCQFIATTHSPQVISEVSHDRIQIMNPTDGVYRPGHSFGVDSSRILEELMDVSPRPTAMQEQHKRISELARPDTLAEAREELAKLADKLGLGESDPDVVRLSTLLDFVEDA